MLTVLVVSAASWMRMGLPLRCFKIVLYAQNVAQLNSTDRECQQVFQTLKVKQESIPIMYSVSMDCKNVFE